MIMGSKIMDKLSDVGDGALAVGFIMFIGWVYIGIPVLACYTIIKAVSTLA